MFGSTKLEDFLKQKTVAGLELILEAEGNRVFNLSILKRKGSMVVNEKTFTGLSSIGQLKEYIPADMPVYLVLNGKGIIHKKVAVANGESDKAILNKVLPNADVNSFYIQQVFAGENHAHISIIRKSIVDELLQELKEVVVISCSLGPFCMMNILPLIGKEHSELTFAGHHLKFGDASVDVYELAEKAQNNDGITIGNDKIGESAIISFASAFGYFISSGDGINSDRIVQQKEEWKEKRKFQLTGWTLLIAAFSILLINYFVFDHFWAKQNRLASSLALNRDAMVQYDQLKKEFSDKYEFLETNGLLELSKTSFYADQLAQDLPPSIRWTGLNIYPLKKKRNILEEEPLAFTGKMILISGSCRQSTALNSWMKTVKNKTWVNDVTLLNYTQDKANEAGIFSLSIKVK